ncbi:hypothetical protein [Nonomuraea soli]|uniref:Uncharacterized protein n=1 Tax=Nonomuraea soli TaxID=1032476 RepID=A0A7W0HPJ9_9ACTN|nr:hypothetical protein [Nonomuraea soli]MBA2890948.1 hypothetical protein [Nonomuraea soli]
MNDDDRRLRDALREEAARHEPRRERMLVRLEAEFGSFETASPEGAARSGGAVRANGLGRGVGDESGHRLGDGPGRVNGGGPGHGLEGRLGHRLEGGPGDTGVRGSGAGGGRGARRWRVLVLPAAAVAAVAAGAWWLTGTGPDTGPPAVAVPGTSASTAAASPAAEGRPDPRSTARSAQEQASPAPTAQPSPTQRASAPGVKAQALVDPNSNPYWAQNNLVLTFDKQAAGLAVTMRVKRTPGVAPAGLWSSLPGDDYTSSVREEPGAVVYRWALKDGRAVRPGTYTFAAQYNRRPQPEEGRAGDTYLVVVPGGRLSGHL